MSAIIEDPVESNKARVDGSGRLLGFNIVENVNDFSVKGGDAYNIATDLLALTGTGSHSVIYMKNTGVKDIVVTNITLGVGVLSATITDDVVFTLIKNPTGGDLITDTTAVGSNLNLNHTSPNILGANVYQGKQGGTITGGNEYGPFYVSAQNRSPVDLTMRIPTGQSLGVKVDLNTSGGGNVYVAINCHTHDDTQL